jgi:hypothetical protein
MRGRRRFPGQLVEREEAGLGDFEIALFRHVLRELFNQVEADMIAARRGAIVVH